MGDDMVLFAVNFVWAWATVACCIATFDLVKRFVRSGW